MYQLLALINGIILSVMISVNGNLSVQYSAFTAAAIIHAVGSCLHCCSVPFRKQKTGLDPPAQVDLSRRCNRSIYNSISKSGLHLHQHHKCDRTGTAGTDGYISGDRQFRIIRHGKRPLPRYALIGLSLSVFGIFVMLDTTVTTAAPGAAISFASGIPWFCPDSQRPSG